MKKLQSIVLVLVVAFIASCSGGSSLESMIKDYEKACEKGNVLEAEKIAKQIEEKYPDNAAEWTEELQERVEAATEICFGSSLESMVKDYEKACEKGNVVKAEKIAKQIDEKYPDNAAEWTEELQERVFDATVTLMGNAVEEMYDDAMDEAIDMYDDAMDEAKDMYDDAMDEAKDMYDDAMKDAKKVAGEMYDDAMKEAEKMMDEAIEEAEDMMDEAMSEVW